MDIVFNIGEHYSAVENSSTILSVFLTFLSAFLGLLGALGVDRKVQKRESIKKVKENLVRAETDSASSFPFLEVHFVLAFYFKEPCYLLVFPDGEALLAIHSEYDLSDRIGTIGSHIKINFNQLIQRIYPNRDLKPNYKKSIELSPEEMELMLFVRTGNFETITVKRKDGKIDFIEATETLSADARLTEILKEQDYQNIEIKTAEGKTVCVKRTIKKKLQATG